MKSRDESLQIAKDTTFDVIILGGGIVGAGVAQNAASRGLSTLLIEKNDFGSGTSSKTTKLIHGGLRYLEQFQFRLTRELCEERGLLEQLAPHLVKDFSFLMPINENNKWFSIKAQAGLTLYDLLAGQITGLRKHEKLKKETVIEAAPSLKQDNLAGGLKFHDCISDDARMVMEVIKSATSEGALAINYLEAKEFKKENDRITAVVARDRLRGEDIVFNCHSCVNATGVWSDAIAKQMDTSWKDKVIPAKGTHIMVPLSSFETNTALFLPTKDNRYVFVVPWQKALMIGTTDTAYNGSVDNALPTEEEIDYLLSVVNQFTNGKGLSRKDVIAAWAGLRPLVGAHDKELAGDQKEETSTLSREHYLFEGPENVVGLIGGKLTNYRILSEQIMDKIVEKLPVAEKERLKPSRTHEIMLGGWQDKATYLSQCAIISTKSRTLNIEPASIDHLITSYGADALEILSLIEQEQDSFLAKRICPDFPQIMAEVVFAVKKRWHYP